MPDRLTDDELADLIENGHTGDEDDCEDLVDALASELLELRSRVATFEQARRRHSIEHVEQLNLLPEFAIVTDRDCDVWQRRGGQWCSYETAPRSSAELMKFRPLGFVAVALPRGDGR